METTDLNAIIDQIVPLVTRYGLQILGAILILLLGRFVAGVMAKLSTSALTRAKVEPSLVGFAANLVKTGIIVIAVIAALSKFGVQTTSLIAIIGAAGLAIGLALQGSLSNFASGVLILLFRPFKAGDVIDSGGTRGKVVEIGIFTTTISTFDNQKVIIPNSAITGGKIVNINAFPTRRVDLVAGISYGDDVGKAVEVLRGILASNEKILSDPVPIVEVLEMAESSVNLAVRPWVNTPDYWPVYWELNRAIKDGLDQNGITIPFPQRDVHVFQATGHVA